MTAIPQLNPDALQQRYALLCESTRPEPDEDMLPYRVEQGLQALDKLLATDLRALSRKGAPDDFTDIYHALERELERLREFCAFPALASKVVVAFGGGFSAGKSSLINALLGHKLLVTEVDPTTSLPTYLLHGERNEVSALNLFGHRVLLSEADFLSLTHDEPLLYGSHISRLLRAAFMTRADFPWPQLALIDTPGYSKDGQAAHSERTDEHIARTQLNAAQAIVWVVDARQGCITEDDLAFLGTLRRDIPLFIAISRADQKPDAELPGIQQVIGNALQQRGITVAGMAAVSARKPRAWPLEVLLAQLQQWNGQPKELRFAQNFQAEFQRYDQFLAAQQAQAQSDLNQLNRILALSDSKEVQAEATAMKDHAQVQHKALAEQTQQLEALWHTFGTQLHALGQQVGMALPAPGVLRPAAPAAAQASIAAPQESQLETERQRVLARALGLRDQIVQLASPKSGQGSVLCDGGGLPELVLLPGGSFRMGSEKDNTEQPIHTVHIRPFAMGKFPVTQAQWQKVMGSNPSHFKGDDRCPVEQVDWNDAQAFIQKLNHLTGHTYRLPSESEWEYACRAGSTGEWCFGDDERRLDEYAWYDGIAHQWWESYSLGDTSHRQTHPVGGKDPNAFGLYDMHGNVWEWCEDYWVGDYRNAPVNGEARSVDLDGMGWRVSRGGGWDHSANLTRAASRMDHSAEFFNADLGFRLARDYS